jgi:hypothetical protein
MVRVAIAAVSWLLLVSAQAAGTGTVAVLTDLNFDSIVNSTTPWMIDVYAPW